MTLVAAAVETRRCASSLARLDGTREIRLPGDGGVDLLARNAAAASGASVVKTRFFSIARLSSAVRPDCDSM